MTPSLPDHALPRRSSTCRIESTKCGQTWCLAHAFSPLDAGWVEGFVAGAGVAKATFATLKVAKVAFATRPSTPTARNQSSKCG
ncbi:hypothetical protein, partial [Amycolatopsis lurida]|uniref:hypothetical protein n=1 Tax=Amycolatopsis lurida TaxID=31959 RepID=UPI00378F4F19